MAFVASSAPDAFAQKAEDEKKVKEESTVKATGNTGKLLELFDVMSRIRVYIEFFYMEAGDYPDSLSQLDHDLNSILPRGLDKVKIPTDPASGKDFIYERNQDKKGYVLKAPEPSLYGVDKIELSQVPWAGFSVIAEDRKYKFLQTISVENIRGLATAVEYYAKDNGGKFPKELKDLIPKYLKTMPVCPVSGKFYEYKVTNGDYTIKSPSAKELKMEELMFSSRRGWVTR